jgi:hypothetical protein
LIAATMKVLRGRHSRNLGGSLVVAHCRCTPNARMLLSNLTNYHFYTAAKKTILDKFQAHPSDAQYCSGCFHNGYVLKTNQLGRTPR